MSLHITPSMVEHTYLLLCATPPFSRWKLPHADAVQFQIIGSKRYYGDHSVAANGEHVIRISTKSIGSVGTLITTVAHEMVHMRQAMRGDRDIHGKSFERYGAAVCRYHNFDPVAFV